MHYPAQKQRKVEIEPKNLTTTCILWEQRGLVVRAPDLLCCNPEVPGSSPALTTWICFTVAPFSNPRSCFVNSQLVCLPPVGIFNMLC